MTATSPKPTPQPGDTWTMSDALVSILADTPVTVTGVHGGLVHFTTAGGLSLSFRSGTFRGLFDPVRS